MAQSAMVLCPVRDSAMREKMAQSNQDLEDHFNSALEMLEDTLREEIQTSRDGYLEAVDYHLTKTISGNVILRIFRQIHLDEISRSV